MSSRRQWGSSAKGINSILRSRLACASARILAPMFQALRTAIVLGLLAAGIPVFLPAQATAPNALPAGQQDGKPAAGAPHAAQVDDHHRPITAGGFVSSGPTVFADASEKAGLTHWTHKMGTPSKSYIIETKGSGVGLIDYDNDGWLDIYVVNGSTAAALEGKEPAPHAALFHNNHDGTFTDVRSEEHTSELQSLRHLVC